MINLAKNQLKDVPEDTFIELSNLKLLDLRENQLTKFFSFPESPKLETIQLGFNNLLEIGGFSRAANLVTFDLKNNKLTVLPEEIFLLKSIKILDISNNDLQNLPSELGLMKNLGKMQVEGNPLRSIRMAIRQGGSEVIKKYLASRISAEEIEKVGNQASQAQPNDPKARLIKQEYFDKGVGGNASKITLLIRQLKNTNGDLDLRDKNLRIEDFTEDVLKVDKVKTLDLSGNQLTRIPPHVDALRPASLKVSQNPLGNVRASELLAFSGLTSIEMKGSKLSSFGDDVVNFSRDDTMLFRMNYEVLTYLDLSQNLLTAVPKVVGLMPALRNLILAYNSIQSIDCLFVDGMIPNLDHLDMSNNGLVSIPSHIYKWQTLTSLVLQNNNIKSFPPEMGFLNLKTVNISGNPTMLLKNNSANKGAAGLMNYLRERVPDKLGMEKEVAHLQNNIRERQKMVGTPLPKKPNDLQEYGFVDPFKQKAVEYNKKHDEKYGEVFEEDVKSYLEAKRSPQSHNPHRMDEETPSRGMGYQQAGPGQRTTKMDEEPAARGFGGGNHHGNRTNKLDEERPVGNKKVTPMEPETNFGEVSGKIGRRYGNAPVGEGMGIIGASSQYSSPPKQAGFGAGTRPTPEPNRPLNVHPTNKSVGQGETGETLKELDIRIKQMQDKLDNDYTLSKPKAQELRKELQLLKVQRNGLTK